MIVASHRGPYRFVRSGDGFEAVRGAGGVVSSLGPLLIGGNGDNRDGGERTCWIAAALSDDDRAAVGAGAADAPGVDLRLLALDPETHRLHYDVVSNELLWFLYHGLLDLGRSPTFGTDFTRAWDAYYAVNERFAHEIAADARDGEEVLVQDYQLSLVPGMVRGRRPDLRIAYFHHTPFCDVDAVRVLPEPARRALLGSLTSAPAGFHARRWLARFTAAARDELDTAPRGAFVAPLGPDPAALEAVAASAGAAEAARELDELVGDRALVYRTDRIEPSKNIVRGFQAFGLLLEQRRELRGRVVFVASLYPSRERLPAYAEYAAAVDAAAAGVNDRFATRDWTPIVLDVRDDYPRSVAGLGRYDVLLVNPVRDGLNLVAKEGPLVNRRDGVLCLSPEAGAFEELGSAALAVHPFDLVATASAIGAALDAPAGERAERAARLRAAARSRTPESWLADQMAAARAASAGSPGGATAAG